MDLGLPHDAVPGPSRVSVAALIVAAGRGERFGGPLRKSYMPLGGAPLLRHSVAAYCAHPEVGAVRVVIHRDDAALYEAAVGGLALLAPVPGGATRQQSVRAGLESLVEEAPDRVLIHDGARPFPGSAIAHVLRGLEEAPGAVAALPLRDTLKSAEGGRILATVDRTGLWRAQTPQGFRFADILAAHRAAGELEATDDAGVAERAGIPVSLVPGSEHNIKVTTPEDLARAEGILMSHLGDVRCAMGFDVHRFVPGDGVRLCGVAIPYDRALAGHSDADVALHALTDALLGALGEGDIGLHFPPDDAQWRDADSAVFVRRAAAMVAERGGQIGHIDLTLICEAPQIAPHRSAMVASLAALLGIAESRVSVKATTTERLGFTGRGEGIAAQATATVRLPF